MDVENGARDPNVNTFDSIKSNKLPFIRASMLLAVIGLQVSACQSLDTSRKRIEAQEKICIRSVDVKIPNPDQFQWGLVKKRYEAAGMKFNKNEILYKMKSYIESDVINKYGECGPNQLVNRAVLKIFGFRREKNPEKDGVNIDLSFDVIEQSSEKVILKFQGSFWSPIRQAPKIILNRP